MGERIESHAGEVPLLRCENVSAGYGESVICKNISFELMSGQMIAIVGPNGSGKSTIAKTILYRQQPVEGTVRLNGSVIDDRTVAHRATVSSVLDEDMFFPTLTVAEHLELVARGHSLSQVAAKVADELTFFGLEQHAAAYPHELSSGQRRRVLLAAALIRPFELLVLDEPEQRLDKEMKSRLADRLKRTVAGGQAGALIVTHDLDLVGQTADFYLVAGSSASLETAATFRSGQIV